MSSPSRPLNGVYSELPMPCSAVRAHWRASLALAMFHLPSVEDVEDRGCCCDGLVIVALIVQKHAYTDPSPAAGVRGTFHAERPDLAPRHEHHMPAHDLNFSGADRFCRQVDG